MKPIKRIGKTADSMTDSRMSVVDLTSSNRTMFATSTNFRVKERAAAATPGKAEKVTKED